MCNASQGEGRDAIIASLYLLVRNKQCSVPEIRILRNNGEIPANIMNVSKVHTGIDFMFDNRSTFVTPQTSENFLYHSLNTREGTFWNEEFQMHYARNVMSLCDNGKILRINYNASFILRVSKSNSAQENIPLETYIRPHKS